jgi:hypothetical protein
MQKFAKLALVAPMLATVSAFAAADPVTDIQTSVSASLGGVVGLVVTLGLIMIGITFAHFALRKGSRVASGKV